MNNIKKIIVTGGGTGGHFYPALAVAQEIRRKYPEADISFIGTLKGIEAQGAPAAGFNIRHIKAEGFGFKPLKLIKFAANNTLGMLQAIALLKTNRPQLIIGSGGFVSCPVLLAAKTLRIPFVILEQNVLPGKVNKLMAPYASKILASFEASQEFLPKKNLVITGNPVRNDIIERTREEALNKLNLSPEKFTLLITGASQGAKSINNAVLKSLPRWKEKPWQILHLAGKNNFEEVNASAEQLRSTLACNYKCIDYTEDIASMYAVANLVIARAGASTLAELTARGLPAILIPYPYAADNHQEKNARWLEKSNAAIVITDNRVEEELADKVINLEKNRETLQQMAKNSQSKGKPEALKTIIEQIEQIIP